MGARLHTQQVYCRECCLFETLLFAGRRLVGNTKWRQGRGGQIYHCHTPCVRGHLVG